MTLNTAEQLNAIDHLDLEYLRDRYVATAEESHAPFDEALSEFKRFMRLIAVQDQPLAVTNRSVDHLWHTFLIHTKSYSDFCAEVFGEYIHHQPHSAKFPVPLTAISNTISAYGREYGQTPDSWFDDPLLDRAAIARGEMPTQLAFQWSGWTGRSSVR